MRPTITLNFALNLSLEDKYGARNGSRPAGSEKVQTSIGQHIHANVVWNGTYSLCVGRVLHDQATTAAFFYYFSPLQ